MDYVKAVVLRCMDLYSLVWTGKEDAKMWVMPWPAGSGPASSGDTDGRLLVADTESDAAYPLTSAPSSCLATISTQIL